MGISFNRGAEVTIARPVQFFENSPNAILIKDLRVAFRVERDLSNKANSCQIEISNLAQATRAELQEKPLSIRLEAGFFEDGVPDFERLFVGDLRYASSKRNPTGWTTKLQMGDGDRAIQYARLGRSYKGGVDSRTVLNDLVKSMGLRLPTSVQDARELAGQFVGGLSVSGPSSKQITTMLESKGFGWSIQDGTLQILRENETNQTQALVISQETGMEGSPEFGPPTRKGKKPRLKVTSRLKPGVSPGGVIQVISKEVEGLFLVIRVVHSGDTHGMIWSSEIESTPL